MRLINGLTGFLVILLILNGCNRNSENERYINWDEKLVSIRDSIHDIRTSLIFGDSWPYILNDYLLLCEISPSKDKGVHVFNKNSFEYITSTAIAGEGPGEVARQGLIVVNPKRNDFWLSDHAKMVVWKFPLDSVLKNPNFKPLYKFDLFSKLFIERYGFLNDSTAIGKAVGVLSSSSFAMHMVKLDMSTNITTPFGYEHPKTTGKHKSNSSFGLSVNGGFYVNCYYNIDLVTICDLQGNLRCNIYGAGWKNRKKDINVYFYKVDVYNKYIIASYINDKGEVVDHNQRTQGNLPTKLVIMDCDGNHIKTLDLGCKFKFFCVDEQNKRVIIYFNDREKPLGYINLNLPA